MHLRQKENYGCGVYSIANALQCEDFVTNEKLELSINGNNVGQLGAWLYEYRIQCFLSCVIYNNEEVIDIFDLNPTFIEDCENQWVPFFIIIKTNGEMNHRIGCRYMKNGSIVVHDSLYETEFVYDCFDCFEKAYYGKIIAYDVLRNYQNEPIFIKLNN